MQSGRTRRGGGPLKGGREDGLVGWCESFGLSTTTAQVLRSNHFRTIEDVEHLNADSIEVLHIAPAEKGLLRGAILQHKVNQRLARMVVEEKERIIREDGLQRRRGQTHSEVNREPLTRRQQQLRTLRMRRGVNESSISQGIDGRHHEVSTSADRNMRKIRPIEKALHVNVHDSVNGNSGSRTSSGNTGEHISMQSASEGSSQTLNRRSLIAKSLYEAPSIETTSHREFAKLPTVHSATSTRTTGNRDEVNKVSDHVTDIHRSENSASGSEKGRRSNDSETRKVRFSPVVSDVEVSRSGGESYAWNEIEEYVRRSVRRKTWKEAMADLDHLFTDEELAMVNQSQRTDYFSQTTDGARDSTVDARVR